MKSYSEYISEGRKENLDKILREKGSLDLDWNIGSEFKKFKTELDDIKTKINNEISDIKEALNGKIITALVEDRSFSSRYEKKDPFTAKFKIDGDFLFDYNYNGELVITLPWKRLGTYPKYYSIIKILKIESKRIFSENDPYGEEEWEET